MLRGKFNTGVLGPNGCVTSYMGDSYEDYSECYATSDKSTPFPTYVSWDSPEADKERTVFGAKKQGLFYNYDDRLIGADWFAGLEAAKQDGLTPKTALWFEKALNHFHGSSDVDLQHVILGCNRSTGHSYLIFGYTYTTDEH